MRRLFYKFHNVATLFGLDLLKLRKSIKGLRFFYRDLREFKKQKSNDDTFPLGSKKAILDEREETSGNMKGHYFHQDLYVARQIFLNNPEKHLDIGSRTDGFVAHVACYRKIEIMDIRPQEINIKNISFKQADLMILPEELISKYDSISSLHVIEHFGLGRYGDPIDYNGHLKAIENIAKMLRKGGMFYFSTPIGKQRVEFNAHRVFSVQYLVNILSEYFTVKKFSFVNDEGDFFEGAPLDEKAILNDYNFSYGCGIFELIKN